MIRIIIIVGIVMILTSCVKDYDLNPASTIVRFIINDSST
jgi:hypothetical protein